MANTYDCTPRPKPEGVVHHTARVIYNLFHPHHKAHYIAPIGLTCKEPEMAIVTVTASQDAPPAIKLPPDSPVSYVGGGAFNGYYVTSVPYTVQPAKPIGVPEPTAFAMMLPALLAIALVHCRAVRSNHY